MRREGDDLLGRLDTLAQRRAPYADLLADVVRDSLLMLADAPGPIVEIGAGDGQLQAWLPSELRARCIVTEPARAGVHAIAARAPRPALVRAEASRLPFATGRVGAAIGLCVFDAVDDPAGAAAEIARLLAPGGRFVHFLDMSTLRRRPFVELAGQGLVPIPNVFGDASAHEWPLDMLLLRRDRLEDLLAFARGVGHPLPATFGPAFAPFLSPPFDADAAIEAFRAVARNAELRSALAGLLASADRLASAAGHPPLEPSPFHSGRYLQSVLDETFSRAGLFEVEQSGVVAKAEVRAARPDEAKLVYRSLSLGHERLLDALPAHRLAGPTPGAPAPGRVLVEVGVFVFAARRVG